MWLYYTLWAVSIVMSVTFVLNVLTLSQRNRPFFCRLGAGLTAAGTCWLMAYLTIGVDTRELVKHPYTLNIMMAFSIMYAGYVYRDIQAAVRILAVWCRRTPRRMVRKSQDVAAKLV